MENYSTNATVRYGEPGYARQVMRQMAEDNLLTYVTCNGRWYMVPGEVLLMHKINSGDEVSAYKLDELRRDMFRGLTYAEAKIRQDSK